METTSQAPPVICPKCKEQNFASNAFCKKCGEILRPTNIHTPELEKDEVSSKGGSKIKNAFLIIGGLAFLAALAGGSYFWYDLNLKKVAKKYVEESSGDFNKVVNAVNALSTEKEIEQGDDSDELYLKKLQDEKNNIEIAVKEITDAKGKLENRVKNRLVSSFDEMQRQFLSEAGQKVSDYDEYMAYNIKMIQSINSFMKEEEKVENDFETISSPEDLAIAFKAMRDVLDSSNNELKSISPPEGLKEAHEKLINYFTDFSINLTNIITAIEQNNMEMFVEAGQKFEEFVNNEAFDEIGKLVDYYFNDMHKQIESLRAKADKVKVEYLVYKTQLKASVGELNIEGW